jgi:hypothetical protein
LGDVKFFQPVFNIADAAISIGVASILLFQRHYFSDEKPKNIGELTSSEGEVVENMPNTEGSVFDNTEVITNNDVQNNDEQIKA